MTMNRPEGISPEAQEAVETLNRVLAPLGTNLKHYMPVHRDAAINEMAAAIAAIRSRKGA